MEKVRIFGGILEHPYNSKLWSASHCTNWGTRDEFGGILLPVYQNWWGHRALKKTGLYIVGPVPKLPYEKTLNPTCEIELMGVKEREKTPENMAIFLAEHVKNCAGWGMKCHQ